MVVIMPAGFSRKLPSRAVALQGFWSGRFNPGDGDGLIDI